MPSLLPRKQLLALLLTGMLACKASTLCGEVAISMADGRTLSGKVDARTDDDSLWLRHEEQGIVLATAVNWSQIDLAAIAGEEVSVERLHEHAASHKSEGPQSFLTEYEIYSPDDEHRDDVAHAHYVVEEPAAKRRIVRLEADAAIAGFNRNVENDGIVVWLAAMDAAGRGVPFRGTASVRLIGMKTDPQSGRISFDDIQRWSRQLDVDKFEAGATELSLPFRRFRPEFDLDVCGEALVHVRVTVYGEGNYEASVPILLHEFNPFRDYLEMFEGTRFYPNELTTNTLQGLPATYRGPRQRPR